MKVIFAQVTAWLVIAAILIHPIFFAPAIVAAFGTLDLIVNENE